MFRLVRSIKIIHKLLRDMYVGIYTHIYSCIWVEREESGELHVLHTYIQ